MLLLYLLICLRHKLASASSPTGRQSVSLLPASRRLGENKSRAVMLRSPAEEEVGEQLWRGNGRGRVAIVERSASLLAGDKLCFMGSFTAGIVRASVAVSV